MTIKIDKLEKLESEIDDLHRRAESASQHITAALFACEKGDDPTSSLVRVGSTLAQLEKGVARVYSHSQRVLLASQKAAAKPTPKAPRKAKKGGCR